MQGMKDFIATADKIRYINQLLKVGFDTIDFGSFVSPKAIPQMADTAQVLDGLDLSTTSSQLLSIVANTRATPIAPSKNHWIPSTKFWKYVLSPIKNLSFIYPWDLAIHTVICGMWILYKNGLTNYI